MPGISRHKLVFNWLLRGLLLLSLTAQAAETSLYQQLGGEAGLRQLTVDLVERIQRNPHLRLSFKGSNLQRLQSLLQEQLCELSDGPCRYSGDDMLAVHRGLAISELQFNALVEDLQDAMTAQAIPSRVQNRLLARLAPMKPQIIQQK